MVFQKRNHIWNFWTTANIFIEKIGIYQKRYNFRSVLEEIGNLEILPSQTPRPSIYTFRFGFCDVEELENTHPFFEPCIEAYQKYQTLINKKSDEELSVNIEYGGVWNDEIEIKRFIGARKKDSAERPNQNNWSFLRSYVIFNFLLILSIE